MKQRVFILSPASCSGRRAQIVMSERATFELAQTLHGKAGAPLAEVFTFLSGLYFRGKIAYARKYAYFDGLPAGVFVITAGRGLMTAETPIGIADLQHFASVPIDVDEPRYRDPLVRDVKILSQTMSVDSQVVLLGSVATDKYVQVLSDVFGERLLFPREFVGRGDMSRGGMMLRCVAEDRELEYIPVVGAVRHGSRPAKLPKRVL